MKKQRKKQIIKGIGTAVAGIVIVCGLCAVFMSGSLLGSYLQYRNHWAVTTKESEFTESGRLLVNPNRGFYNLYGFVLTEEGTGYARQVAEKMYNDPYELSLIQINLREYNEGPITETGLIRLEELFQALGAQEKQYIIRFLYDWNGKAEETEPKDVQVILGHMSQMEEILEKYKSMMFMFQGIFVGDCGEMHGSVHMETDSMELLMKQWLQVTPEEVFLGVRTPQQWRILTGISDAEKVGSDNLSCRLGLYNDGMMGTTLDTGTYGDLSKTEAGATGKWIREEELDFQQELCKLVPNGGEVIIDNPVNDLENAIDTLATMHVTYLNRAYDQNVLNKWAEKTITEEGCFQGMDGLSYVERHLGYRLLIENSQLDYEFLRDSLKVTVNIKNVGFAPLYKEPEAYLVMRHKETNAVTFYSLDSDIRSLYGGNAAEKLLSLEQEFSLAGYGAGIYELFFYLKDTDSGCYIEFANEQELKEYGYFLGSFVVEEIKNPFTGEPLDLGEHIGGFLEQQAEKQQREGKMK